MNDQLHASLDVNFSRIIYVNKCVCLKSGENSRFQACSVATDKMSPSWKETGIIKTSFESAIYSRLTLFTLVMLCIMVAVIYQWWLSLFSTSFNYVHKNTYFRFLKSGQEPPRQCLATRHSCFNFLFLSKHQRCGTLNKYINFMKLLWFQFWYIEYLQKNK